MNDEKIKSAFMGAVTGDALGTPLNGLSRAHIKSVFKTISGYTDPAPALKGKMTNWKKPGSYSAISQLMLLLSFADGSDYKGRFNKLMEESIGSGEDDFGIFRYPEENIQNLIRNIASGNIEDTYIYPDASIALILFSLMFRIRSNGFPLTELLKFSRTINNDIDSSSGSIVFNMLAWEIVSITDDYFIDLPAFIPERLNFLIKFLETQTPSIFDAGYNPDSFLTSVKDMAEMLNSVFKEKDTENAERMIVENLNRRIKTPATRATINHPFALIPFAFYIVNYFRNSPSEILFRTAEFGGASSVLCAMTGCLAGTVYGNEIIADALKDELINKRKILNLIDRITQKDIPENIIYDFIKNESLLTQKEVQEKNAKLKHVKIKPKKKKTKKEYEKEMSLHVVESWTKYDKKKWRKKLDKGKFTDQANF